MRINVKPLTHWIIYKGYTVRFTQRTPTQVIGILRTPDEQEIQFTYDPQALVIKLPHKCIVINEHGWVLEEEIRSACDSGASGNRDGE